MRGVRVCYAAGVSCAPFCRADDRSQLDGNLRVPYWRNRLSGSFHSNVLRCLAQGHLQAFLSLFFLYYFSVCAYNPGNFFCFESWPSKSVHVLDLAEIFQMRFKFQSVRDGNMSVSANRKVALRCLL